MEGRNHGFADHLVMLLDGLLRGPRAEAAPARPSPAAELPETLRDPAGREAAARLMRVNHTGEVCAQALYLGQSALARGGALNELLRHAAREELDHLHWCRERLAELDSHPSRLDPVWFAGAYAIGAASALAGDAHSLGFLEETERQVVQHLEQHLERLPPEDRKSRAVLSRMQRDEARHAATAQRHGARRPPLPVRLLMRAQASLMKAIAARI